MDNQTFINRTNNFNASIRKFSSRLGITIQNIQNIIDKFGATKDTLIIARDYHQMKVDELELLEQIYYGILDSKDYPKFKDGSDTLMDEIKIALDNQMLDAQDALVEITKEYETLNSL